MSRRCSHGPKSSQDEPRVTLIRFLVACSWLLCGTQEGCRRRRSVAISGQLCTPCTALDIRTQPGTPMTPREQDSRQACAELTPPHHHTAAPPHCQAHTRHKLLCVSDCRLDHNHRTKFIIRRGAASGCWGSFLARGVGAGDTLYGVPLMQSTQGSCAPSPNHMEHCRKQPGLLHNIDRWKQKQHSQQPCRIAPTSARRCTM